MTTRIRDNSMTVVDEKHETAFKYNGTNYTLVQRIYGDDTFDVEVSNDDGEVVDEVQDYAEELLYDIIRLEYK